MEQERIRKFPETKEMIGGGCLKKQRKIRENEKREKKCFSKAVWFVTMNRTNVCNEKDGAGNLETEIHL